MFECLYVCLSVYVCVLSVCTRHYTNGDTGVLVESVGVNTPAAINSTISINCDMYVDTDVTVL